MDRNQRQAQRVEPAQQALQGSLVDGAGQGSNRWTIALAFDRNGHPSGPIRPALVNVSRHFDLVGCWSIQGKPLSAILHHCLLIPTPTPSLCQTLTGLAHSGMLSPPQCSLQDSLQTSRVRHRG
jgi:hypothetical protein